MSTFTSRIHDVHARIDAAVLLAIVCSSICLTVALGAGIAAAFADPALAAPAPTAVDQPASAHDHGS